MKPRYIHNCSACVFLGRYKEHDLYVCQGSGGHKEISTVVARFGDEGRNYTSGLCLALHSYLEGIPSALTEALGRAMALGFVVPLWGGESFVDRLIEKSRARKVYRWAWTSDLRKYWAGTSKHRRPWRITHSMRGKGGRG